MKLKSNSAVRLLSFLWALLAIVSVLQACSPPTDPQSQVQSAKQYYAKGEYQASIIELKNILREDPNNKEARLLLGKVYLHIEDAEGAKKELQRAYSLGVNDNEIHILFGEAYLLNGEFDRVIEELHPEMMGTAETAARALELIGYAYLGKQEPEKAKTLFLQALGINNKSVATLLGLAEATIVLGNIQTAGDFIAKALAADPENIKVWLAKGEFEFKSGHYSDSEVAFHKAVVIADDSRRVTARKLQAYAGLTKAALAQGKLHDAQRSMKKHFLLAPRHPVSLYLNAVVAYQSSDYSTTVSYLQQLLKVVPDYIPAIALMGSVNFALGNLEQADMYFSNLLVRDPSNAFARKLLVATRLRLDKPREALETGSTAIDKDSEDADLLAMAGIAMFRIGDQNSGIVFLERAAKADPANVALQEELAIAYLSAGQLESAQRVLEKLNDGPDATARGNRLTILVDLQRKDYQAALHKIEGYVATHADDATALNLAGIVYELNGQMEEAHRFFEKALSIRPDYTVVLLNLARLAYAEERFNKAELLLLKALELDPVNTNGHLMLALVAQAKGDHSKSIEWLEKARSKDASAIKPRLLLIRYYLESRNFVLANQVALETKQIAPDRADVLNSLGVTQIWVRDYRNAAGNFRKASELAPDATNIVLNLARAELALKNVKAAKQFLRKVLEQDPGHFSALSMLAVIEMREGHSNKAFSLVRQQKFEGVASSKSIVLEGDLHMMEGNYEKAIADYEKAQGISPNREILAKLYLARKRAGRPDAYEPLIDWVNRTPGDLQLRILLADAYLGEGQHKEAMRQYESVIDVEPDNLHALNNLAWVYFLEQDSRAAEVAERAHKIQPQSGSVTDTYGWIMLQQGELKRGLELLKQAALQSADVPDIRYHYAVALARMGDRDEARKILKQLLDSGVTFNDATNARELLEKL